MLKQIVTNIVSSSSVQTDRPVILVVDDTPENLVVLGECLMSDYQVRVANSGQRALELANTLPRPDLILLDIMMPGMDGYAVLGRLKADVHTSRIPVIFVTALGATEDEAYGLNQGAADYITKPVKPAIVKARVQTHLQLKQARDILHDKNAWLEHEVERRVEQYHKLQDVVLRALACLAEVRDKETGNHILRTQAYVRELATEMATLPRYAEVLTPDVIDAYAKAAPLHDIGKVGIPDNILLKPGKLTPEEWVVMMTHAQIGADAIVRAIQLEPDQDALSFLHDAIDIARHHHEKWDGSGYPDRLKGDEIPLSARLMALADVFDALISKRTYKDAFSLERAEAILLEGRGQHFDPDVVDAYLRRRDAFARIAARFAEKPPEGEAGVQP